MHSCILPYAIMTPLPAQLSIREKCRGPPPTHVIDPLLWLIRPRDHFPVTSRRNHARSNSTGLKWKIRSDLAPPSMNNGMQKEREKISNRLISFLWVFTAGIWNWWIRFLLKMIFIFYFRGLNWNFYFGGWCSKGERVFEIYSSVCRWIFIWNVLWRCSCR